MTITEDYNNTATGNPSGKFAAAANAEPDIPVAFASVLDENPPATVPGYAAASTDTAAYEPTATPTQPTVVQGTNVQASAPVAQPSYATATSTTIPPPTTAIGNRPVPPNAPPGGQWVRVKYAGNQTWGIIGGVGCCLFWFCMMITAPLAFTGLWCPCDEKVAYMSPSGVIYDETGRAMGDRRRNKFTVLGKA